MPSNVEIKAMARDARALREAAARIAAGPPEMLHQIDTFFEVPRGRLKLRVVSSVSSIIPDDAGIARARGSADAPAGDAVTATSAELIFYERANALGPRESAYVITPVANAEGMLETLSRALGVRGVVRKTRTLYLAGQTRIHLDAVDGLGEFVELETVMRPNQSIEEGTRVTESVMRSLGIARMDLIDRPYVDLLREDDAARDTVRDRAAEPAR